MSKRVNELDQLLGTMWSENDGCEISQVGRKTVNEYEKLSNEELLEVRSNLEVELSNLDREMRLVEHSDKASIEFNGRSLYDVEMDRNYHLDQINEVKEELTKRGMKWEGA